MDADIKSKINEILKDLNADELDEVIKIASSRKINHEVVELFQQAVEAKYSTGFICPYCGDTHIVKMVGIITFSNIFARIVAKLSTGKKVLF